MSRNRFDVKNRSARVSQGNDFGARVQDTGTPKTPIRVSSESICLRFGVSIHQTISPQKSYACYYLQ